MWICGECDTFNTRDTPKCENCGGSGPSGEVFISFREESSLSLETEEQIRQDLSVGNLILGPLVGSGSLTLVFQELDDLGQNTGRLLKFLKPAIARDPEVRQGFRRAVQLWEASAAKGVLRPLDFWDGASAQTPWIRINDLGSGTLESFVQGRGMCSPKVALSIGIEIASILCVLHSAGGIHGSLHSRNIFIIPMSHTGESGDERESCCFSPVLVDPFIHPIIDPLRRLDAISQASSSDFGKGQQQDVFALGAIIHHLLTARTPEPNRPEFVVPSSCNEQVPEGLDTAVLLALEEAGYGSMEEFRQSLEKQLEALEIPDNSAAGTVQTGAAATEQRPELPFIAQSQEAPVAEKTNFPFLFVILLLFLFWAAGQLRQDLARDQKIEERDAALKALNQDSRPEKQPWRPQGPGMDPGMRPGGPMGPGMEPGMGPGMGPGARPDGDPMMGGPGRPPMPRDMNEGWPGPDGQTSEFMPEPPHGLSMVPTAPWGSLVTSGSKLANPLGMLFVSLPDGTFKMGSPGSERGRHFTERLHKVTLTRGFLIMDREITCGQWRSIMGGLPPNIARVLGSEPEDDTPVSWISWEDAMDFAARVTARLPEDGTYSLPTEAQWEYACRAGSIRSLGSNQNIRRTTGRCSALDRIGTYAANSQGGPTIAGFREPNGWGLYDMHGNLWEWCLDKVAWETVLQSTTYKEEHEIDPLSEKEGGLYRIARGGSWANEPNVCRSAYRNAMKASFANSTTGFRLVLIPRSSEK